MAFRYTLRITEIFTDRDTNSGPLPPYKVLNNHTTLRSEIKSIYKVVQEGSTYVKNVKIFIYIQEKNTLEDLYIFINDIKNMLAEAGAIVGSTTSISESIGEIIVAEVITPVEIGTHTVF